MSGSHTHGQRAARTRKRRAAAAKAVTTRKRSSIVDKRRAAEAASKEALRAYCEEHKWRMAFFEGKTGAPAGVSLTPSYSASASKRPMSWTFGLSN